VYLDRFSTQQREPALKLALLGGHGTTNAVSGIACGLPWALLVIRRVADWLPILSAKNVTLTLQLVPTGSEGGQELEATNSRALSGLLLGTTAMLEIDTAAVPVLPTITVLTRCEFSTTEPKLTSVGVSVSCMSGGLTVTSQVTVTVRAPSALESFTCAMNSKLPFLLGVPDTPPVVAFDVSPGGRLPFVMEK